MNTVRIPRLLKQASLLLMLLGSNFLLSACGGDGDKKDSNISSSSSSVSSHTFSSTPVTPPLDGTWPNVKVSANGTKLLKFDWTAAPDATYYKLFKKANATTDYVQVGSNFTATTISDPVSVHLADWVNSRYKVQACTAADVCSDSTPVIIDSAMLTAITYVKAPNTDAGDWFGWSIALSGDGKTLAVGAPVESSNAVGINGDQTSNTSPSSGAVYVFVKVEGNWVQEAYLKASNTQQPGDGVSTPIPNPNSRFGYQIALSDDGNTLAVSAINEDSISVSVNCEPFNESYSSYAANSQGYVTRIKDTDIGA
ncbi:MAG: FG-GAP repeat protein, partial [Cellvibrio sp.]